MPEAYDLIEQGKIKTLDDLNRFFTAWLEIAYHQKIHNTFKQRPADRYHKCEHPIRRLPPHELVEIFLLEETRQVDKTNCISLLGTIYEVEPGLAKEKIQLRFDPYDMSSIQVFKDDKRLKDAHILKKRSLKHPQELLEELPPKTTALPKTGLNYVELAYNEYMTKQKEKVALGFSDLEERSYPS